MLASKTALTWEKNERNKTANRHRRYRLSFVRRGTQSEFARHENGLLGSRFSYFYLSDIGENMRGWRLLLKGQGWQVLPKRWIVERTFSWLNHSRRLSKDYELTVVSAETLVKISHIHTLLKRL